MRQRPRVPGKGNPSMKGFKYPTPTQEANSRQMIPDQLKSRAEAARQSFRSGKDLIYRKGNSAVAACGGGYAAEEHETD